MQVTLVGWIQSAGTVKVEGEHKHSGIDADEFLWEKLPGRCCFYGMPNPKQPKQWLGAHSCTECTVWDVPDNYCHTSKESCLGCGMSLYCPTTPPLLAGNKVCTGHSRVGQGCEDTLGTGVCATRSLQDCEAECRRVRHCEMFVFYPEEKQGSCILCRHVVVDCRRLTSFIPQADSHRLSEYFSSSSSVSISISFIVVSLP